MIRLTPRAFNSLGVVLLVALTYVPETTRHLARIREAQAIRGHRLAGIRDWQPILIPLLIGGLERAMTLAEVMVARGYGSPTQQGHNLARQGGLIAGLILALTGWGTALWIGWAGWLLLALSLLILAAIIWQAGREVKHTAYRPRKWGVDDAMFVVASLCPVASSAAYVLGTGQGVLGYQPYPQLMWPPFQPIVGLSVLLLLFPVVGNRLFPR
jgi:energy-coupling factor transport system permease protein